VKEAIGPGEIESARVGVPPAGRGSESEARSQDHPPYFADLYARSDAQRFGLGFGEFAEILQEVSGRYLPADATPAEAAEFNRSLRLEELALARACALGNEPAWECFLNRYRQKLYDIAGAIAKEESLARELADSLYADLFGTRQSHDGRRISKLASYMGRGSFEGWLRTVLAQEFVNRHRRERRLVSFDEHVEAGKQFEAKDAAAQIPADASLELAVDEALAELSAEERLTLASYYLDGRTLAEIARMLGVHESTISRRIEKLTISLRKRIVRGLRQRGMNKREVEQALQADVGDLTLDVRRRLVQEKSE
jgi:RNA polymerase sigma-70 factor (ECF subfamily)